MKQVARILIARRRAGEFTELRTNMCVDFYDILTVIGCGSRQ